MAVALVLRVANADKDSGDPVLLRVEQANEQRLDLQLFATDGENVYVGKTRHSTVEKLKSAAFTGSLQQWQTILFAVLAQQPKALADPIAEHVEIAASIGDALTIVIRKNIDGITQRLGEVALKQNNDEEISLFDWTLDAAAQANRLQESTIGLHKKISETDATIDDLRKQLAEVESKHKLDIEQYMLKFSEILNAKKLEVRNELRRGKKANGRAAAMTEHDEAESKPAAGARATTDRRKRKAASPKEDEVIIKEEEQDLETDVEAPDASAALEQRTPEPDSATGSADEADAQPTGAERESTAEATQVQTTQATKSSSPARRTLPPRRELPFSKPASQKQPSLKESSIADDEDETDDEL